LLSWFLFFYEFFFNTSPNPSRARHFYLFFFLRISIKERMNIAETLKGLLSSHYR
jgi:hypothetical protein